MTKKKIRLSLQIKLIVVLLISLALAALVFYAVYEVGGFLVWRYYLGENDKQERAENYVADFQEYVVENKLSISDTEAISKWSAGWYADIIIYKDQSLIYAPEWFEDFKDEDLNASGDESDLESGDGTEKDSSEETELETQDGEDGISESESGAQTATEAATDRSFYEGWFSGDRGFEQYLTEEARSEYQAALDEALSGNNKLRPVYFLDGTLLVTIVDFTEEAMNNIVFAISTASALAIVAIVMILYFYSVTRRIKLLAASVRQVERGDLEHRIKDTGNDDISRLAGDVNSMRDAIVENMTKEQRAWEANAGLITAMSHDIRTPLTVLLGYLDLIEMQNTDSASGEYISACRDNAMRLKNLSDDMFSYFLVFGKGGNELHPTTVNASEWIGHVLGEQEILLSEKGFKLEHGGDVPSVNISIDEMYFRRVMDNLFSNIIKYADPEYPVVIRCALEGDELWLVCENRVLTDEDKPESNGIGLKTCIKIMEEMGGRLAYGEEDGCFTVELTLPTEKNDNANS